jgi:hypothetical protein
VRARTRRLPARGGAVVGVVLVCAYLVVLALTVGGRSDHVRPLYDGFAPPSSYRWVDPPSFFAAGNVMPEPVATTIKLGAQGSAAAGVATPDGQFAVNLGRGAIAAHAGATRIAIRITPLAPDTLGRVPGGERPNGNAYRIQMTYQPRGGAVTRLARPGSLVIEIPELGEDLYSASNGRAWTKIAARTVPPRNLSLATTLEAPGYYVGGTNLPELVGPEASSSGSSVAIGIGVGALTAVLLVIAFVIVRRRRRRSDPATDPDRDPRGDV